MDGVRLCSALTWMRPWRSTTARVPRTSRYRPAFTKITEVLTGAGLKHDSHGVSPVNPEFSRTHREWENAARAWLSGPTQGNAIIMTCLLVDGRPIHGDLALPEVARVFGDLRLHQSTMRVLLAISIDRSDALRGRWRRKTVDLKRQALLPIANIARWAALSAGSSALPTPERLQAAAGSRMLTAEDANTLGDVFEIVQRMRLRHQLEQLQRGEPSSDTIKLRDVSTIDASVLTDAVREILAIQRRMANKAKYVPDLQDFRRCDKQSSCGRRWPRTATSPAVGSCGGSVGDQRLPRVGQLRRRRQGRPGADRALGRPGPVAHPAAVRRAEAAVREHPRDAGVQVGTA
jgi:hypothetical protein